MTQPPIDAMFLAAQRPELNAAEDRWVHREVEKALSSGQKWWFSEDAICWARYAMAIFFIGVAVQLLSNSPKLGVQQYDPGLMDWFYVSVGACSISFFWRLGSLYRKYGWTEVVKGKDSSRSPLAFRPRRVVEEVNEFHPTLTSYRGNARESIRLSLCTATLYGCWLAEYVMHLRDATPLGSISVLAALATLGLGTICLITSRTNKKFSQLEEQLKRNVGPGSG